VDGSSVDIAKWLRSSLTGASSLFWVPQEVRQDWLIIVYHNHRILIGQICMPVCIYIYIKGDEKPCGN
jgi:hypothetical protein